MTGQALVLRGDARQLPLPDESVDLVCCSPPYWSLRAYVDAGSVYDGQIGSETTPGEYLDALLGCMREMVRVLKPSGSVWLNLGDSYANRATPERVGSSDGKLGRGDRPGRPTAAGSGIREKSLFGMPWRLALRCVDELGLILRRDQIWHKPSAMPESVTDRTRSAHEYLFHLVKQPRYYAAIDLIRTPVSGYERPNSNGRAPRGGQRPRTMLDTCNPAGSLPGSVWEFATEPLRVPDHFGLTHYAAFPVELPRRIILGWSPAGICMECGEGRRPVTDRIRETCHGNGRHSSGAQQVKDGAAEVGWKMDEKWIRSRIVGSSCACTPYTDHPGSGQRHLNAGPTGNHRGSAVAERPSDLGLAPRVGPWREYHLDSWTPPPTRPAVVLDPFGGTGTTALVARALGRIGITVDRSGDYCRLAQWRTTDPGELAKAMRVEKPPAQLDGQGTLFDLAEVTR